MSPNELDRLTDLCSRSTPGPWWAASKNNRKDGVGIVGATVDGDPAPVAVLAGARHTIKTRAANTALIAELRNAAPSLLAAARAVQDLLADETVERAAEALYEHTRDHDYAGAEWDWPNIDRSYDYDGEPDDDPHPEWLRNRYREDVRTVLRAALGGEQR